MDADKKPRQLGLIKETLITTERLKQCRNNNKNQSFKTMLMLWTNSGTINEY